MKNYLFFSITLLLLSATGAAWAGSATWSDHPTTNDWNTAANWMPNTVPNSATDTASFDASNVTVAALSQDTTVEGIVFNPGAGAFTITTSPKLTLTISGSGMTNNSGIVQSFATSSSNRTTPENIVFTNSATAGRQTLFTNQATDTMNAGGRVRFFDSSTAGEASFVNEPVGGLSPTQVEFHDSSTAGSGSFINAGGGPVGGETVFLDSSSAGTASLTAGGGASSGAEIRFTGTSSAANATFIVNGGAEGDFAGGLVSFADSSTAGQGMFIINGSSPTVAVAGKVIFQDSSTTGSATLIANGSTVAGGLGGAISFIAPVAAGGAHIIINGGVGTGGLCGFGHGSHGGTGRVEVYRNGTLSVSNDLSLGSIEGDGIISVLDFDTLIVGSNNLSTLFSGVIENFGGITKAGSGVLTLTGANTYAGRTTVNAGTLLVSNTSGSGTGTGTVLVNAGTLGGSGTIAGAVTVGTGTGPGAALAPSSGSQKPLTLALQNTLTLKADATYTYFLQGKGRKARTGNVIANGVTIESGATFDLVSQFKGAATAGSRYTVLSNTSATPIAGTFANLPDGAIVTVSGNNLQASYEGGDGNDLTLTVVP